MRKPRTFTAEFKRQAVEELLSETTRPAPALQKIQSLIRSEDYEVKKQKKKAGLED